MNAEKWVPVVCVDCGKLGLRVPESEARKVTRCEDCQAHLAPELGDALPRAPRVRR